MVGCRVEAGHFIASTKVSPAPPCSPKSVSRESTRGYPFPLKHRVAQKAHILGNPR